MKKNLYLIMIAFTSLSFAQSDPIDRIGLKGPITFNKTPYLLAWSQKPNANYFVQEYLPKGESVDHFNQLITVNVFVTDISVASAIQQKTQELTKRKETDKVCNFSVINSPEGGESIIDCLLSTGSADKLDVVEFIIYKYKQIELDNNKKALLVYSYSKRGYGDAITPFLTNLGKFRRDLLNVMISEEMPEIKIKE